MTVTLAKIYAWYQPIFEVQLEWTRGTAQGTVTVYADPDEDFGTEYVAAIKHNGGPAIQLYKGSDLKAARRAVEARRQEHGRHVTQCATATSGVQVQEIVPAKVTLNWG